MKKVVVPGGAETIGNYWFWGSDIENVTIPNDIKRIGVEAFCNCAKLKNVVFKKMMTKKNSTANNADISTHQSDEMERRAICTRAFYGCCSL